MKIRIFRISTVLIVSWILCLIFYDGNSMEENFSMIYGWMTFSDISSILVTFTRWLLPQMVLCLFFGNYMEEKFMTVLPYILTRTKTPWRFAGKVYGKIIVSVFGYSLLFAVVPLVIGIAGSPFFHWDTGWDKILLWCSYQVICVVFVNVISTFANSIYGLCGLLCLEGIFWILFRAIDLQTIPETVGKFLPIYGLRFFDGKAIQSLDPSGVFMFAGIIVIGIIGSTIRLTKRDMM